MRIIRIFTQAIAMRITMPSLSKSRKQELIDLGLTVIVAFLIVVYKVNKAA